MAGQKQLFRTNITDVSDSTSNRLDTLGDIRWDGNKCYKYVKFDNGAANEAAVVGNACGYVATTGYAANTVTSDNSDSVNGGMAGVFTSVPADGQYCWIQIKGSVTLNLDPAGSGSDGDPFTYLAAATNGAVTVLQDQSTTAVADALPQLGIIYDDSAKIVLLDCPF